MILYLVGVVLTELTNVHDIVLVLQDSSLVVVNIKVVGRREDGHDRWESGRACLSVHSVTRVLSLVCANDRKQVVLFEEGTRSRVAEEV